MARGQLAGLWRPVKPSVRQRGLLLPALLTLAAYSAPAYAEEEPIFGEEPEVVGLQGFIVKKRFYGPPNYGDSPNSDQESGELAVGSQ